MAAEGPAASADPLAVVEVLDRLEVGPVELEPDRLRVVYRAVGRDGTTSETELRTRWPEAVFEPSAADSRRLASLVAVQVALNYGLFCRRLVLDGPFDAVDRRFLTEMAANTAREIAIHKLFKPNPFLRGAAATLAAHPEGLPRRGFLRAELEFPGAVEAAPEPPHRPSWDAGGDRVAVLASGGKESLLSLGLLEQAGFETHSIFVNESGRHWYTALNAWRGLSASRPGRTHRVWTTADRVFNWMLRRLPFIRPDFADVRSDHYPIRLWTVAVFVFSALPLMARRGLGNLVIGCEYETSVRRRFHGVRHYDGIFDQSRWFDAALSRYYRRRGWPVLQFSLLRHLAAPLVQMALADAYPELLAMQVSCHAAHLDGERARPCGRCEKCRRVVGLILAGGADPRECGYDQRQVEACLATLAERGCALEAPDHEFVGFMLDERGLLPEEAPGFPRRRRRPEILALRFDRNAAPISTIPRRLRRPVLEILLAHAEGAVEKVGRSWRPFDALGELAASRPHPHGDRAGAAPGQAESSAGAERVLLSEMTWPEAAARLRASDTALLPVGAVEQHGPHLPVDIDAWDAEHICREVAARCSAPRPLVLPVIPYGVSYHHDDFPGTLSIEPETLYRLVYDVGLAAAASGISKLVIVNGHGGNGPTLELAAQLINRDAHIFACVDSGQTSDSEVEALIETPNDVHAGEIETSTALATRPDLVRTDRLEPAVPRFSSSYLDFTSGRGVVWYAHTARMSPSGVLGDPTRASREKGERIWELMIGHLVRFVERIKSLSLDEIYQRHH